MWRHVVLTLCAAHTAGGVVGDQNDFNARVWPAFRGPSMPGGLLCNTQTSQYSLGCTGLWVTSFAVTDDIAPSATVPAALGDFQRLEELTLTAFSSLSGFLPPALFANMTSLRRLVISFTGLQGELPPLSANASALNYVSFAYNQFTVQNWTALNLFATRRVDTLDVRGNALSAPPAARDLPANLERLYMGNNRFDSPLPDYTTLGALVSFDADRAPGLFANVSLDDAVARLPTQLAELSLAHCQLSGTIGSSLFNRTQLRSLSLADNHLSGTLPYLSWTSSRLLDSLDLTYNNRSGPLVDRLPLGAATCRLAVCASPHEANAFTNCTNLPHACTSGASGAPIDPCCSRVPSPPPTAAPAPASGTPAPPAAPTAVACATCDEHVGFVDSVGSDDWCRCCGLGCGAGCALHDYCGATCGASAWCAAGAGTPGSAGRRTTRRLVTVALVSIGAIVVLAAVGGAVAFECAGRARPDRSAALAVDARRAARRATSTTVDDAAPLLVPGGALGRDELDSVFDHERPPRGGARRPPRRDSELAPVWSFAATPTYDVLPRDTNQSNLSVVSATTHMDDEWA